MKKEESSRSSDTNRTARLPLPPSLSTRPSQRTPTREMRQPQPQPRRTLASTAHQQGRRRWPRSVSRLFSSDSWSLNTSPCCFSRPFLLPPLPPPSPSASMAASPRRARIPVPTAAALLAAVNSSSSSAAPPELSSSAHSNRRHCPQQLSSLPAPFSASRSGRQGPARRAKGHGLPQRSSAVWADAAPASGAAENQAAEKGGEERKKKNGNKQGDLAHFCARCGQLFSARALSTPSPKQRHMPPACLPACPRPRRRRSTAQRAREHTRRAAFALSSCCAGIFSLQPLQCHPSSLLPARHGGALLPATVRQQPRRCSFWRRRRRRLRRLARLWRHTARDAVAKKRKQRRAPQCPPHHLPLPPSLRPPSPWPAISSAGV